MFKNPDQLFESNYKKLGRVGFNDHSLNELGKENFRPYIKILLVPAGYTLSVDFNSYETTQATLFFINTNQILSISKASNEEAELIYYNRDFYCIQIHDDEVACDGLLFNNMFEIPKVDLDENEAGIIKHLFGQIKEELSTKDSSAEEMIRIHLKQIIIRATREWKKQNFNKELLQIPSNEHDFFRNFSQMVEIHFREKHSVADYADLLNLAPKTLSNKFKKLNLENPNEIIKNRILLEAKRLMMYSGKSIKEISYELGYEDPAYFNRMFSQKSGYTPATFRKELDL